MTNESIIMLAAALQLPPKLSKPEPCLAFSECGTETPPHSLNLQTVCNNSQHLFSAMSCLPLCNISAPELLTIILFPGVLVLVQTRSVTGTSGTSPLRSYRNTIIGTSHLGNTSRTVWFSPHMHHRQEMKWLRPDHSRLPTAKEDTRLDGSHHTCNERQKKQFPSWLKVPGSSCPHWMTALKPVLICICSCVETGGNNCYIPPVYIFISWLSPWPVDHWGPFFTT